MKIIRRTRKGKQSSKFLEMCGVAKKGEDFALLFEILLKKEKEKKFAKYKK